MKKLIVLSVTALMLITQITVYAETPPITKTEQYTITASTGTEIESQIKSLILQSITENGTEYIVSDMDYVIENSKPIKEKKEIKREITYENLYTKNVTAEESITIDEAGEQIKLPLTDIKYSEATITNRKKTVTAYTLYENKTARPNIPRTKTTQYSDKESRKTITVTLPLKNVEVSESKWVNDVNIPITFETESLYYRINGKVVPYNSDKPALKGHENDILESLHLDKSKYKITDIRWNGDFYEKDGIRCRNAIASGARLVNTYRANYEDNIQVPDAQGYKATTLYSTTIENLTGETTHEITVTATYTPVVKENKENNHVPVIIATVAIVSVILLMIAILMILIKKKEGQK